MCLKYNKLGTGPHFVVVLFHYPIFLLAFRFAVRFRLRDGFKHAVQCFTSGVIQQGMHYSHTKSSQV